MVIEIIEKYVNELIDKSTLDEPVWNIEKIRAGKKASWDYIDGCMIMSLLELYKVTKNQKYFFSGWTYRVRQNEANLTLAASLHPLQRAIVLVWRGLFVFLPLNSADTPCPGQMVSFLL